MTRDEFITKNIPLVHALANRFRGRGIEYEELFSAGSVGLVKAYDNFDFSRGVKFSTYAVPVIVGEIKRLFRDFGEVKISRSLKELSRRTARAAEELSIKNGCEPTVSEIAEYLGISLEEAEEALAAGSPTISLTNAEDGSSFDIPSEGEECSVVDRVALGQCLEALPKEDRLLITLRYFRGMTQAQTAQAVGMSQVNVSRREKKILEKLRQALL